MGHSSVHTRGSGWGYGGDGIGDGVRSRGRGLKYAENGIDWLVMWEWVVGIWEVIGTSGLGRMVG